MLRFPYNSSTVFESTIVAVSPISPSFPHIAAGNIAFDNNPNFSLQKAAYGQRFKCKNQLIFSDRSKVFAHRLAPIHVVFPKKIQTRPRAEYSLLFFSSLAKVVSSIEVSYTPIPAHPLQSCSASTDRSQLLKNRATTSKAPPTDQQIKKPPANQAACY